MTEHRGDDSRRGPVVGPPTRPASLKRPPPTAKGRRTREALIRGARQAFERDGFINARVTDMTSLAHVSHGSFYSYFESKEDIFWEVLDEVTDDMFSIPPSTRERVTPASTDTVAAVEDANHQFVDSFRRNAAMIRVLEEVATYNDDFRRHRRDVRHKFIERVERNLRRQQDAGIVGADVDTLYAAHLLGAMIDRFCYAWFVLEEEFDGERAMAELNRVWLASLGMDRVPADVATRPGTDSARRRRAAAATASSPRRRRPPAALTGPTADATPIPDPTNPDLGEVPPC